MLRFIMPQNTLLRGKAKAARDFNALGIDAGDSPVLYDPLDAALDLIARFGETRNDRIDQIRLEHTKLRADIVVKLFLGGFAFRVTGGALVRLLCAPTGACNSSSVTAIALATRGRAAINQAVDKRSLIGR